MRRSRRSLALLVAVLGSSTALAGAPPGQYVVSTDTVTDTKTGLVWQRAVPAASYAWTDAKTYCGALDLGGFSSGWRLPTRRELETLVDRRVGDPGPAIDMTAFPSTPNTFFWTSTPSATSATQAWYVFFRDGTTSFNAIGNTYRVRCVR